MTNPDNLTGGEIEFHIVCPRCKIDAATLDFIPTLDCDCDFLRGRLRFAANQFNEKDEAE